MPLLVRLTYLGNTDTMIDSGFVFGCFVPLVLFWMCVICPFPQTTEHHSPSFRCGPNHLRAVWRLSLGFGTVPAIAVFCWRWSMDEPLVYKKNSMKYAKIPYMLVLRRYWVRLAAISAVWYVILLFPYLRN